MDNLVFLSVDQENSYRQALKNTYPLPARLVLRIVKGKYLLFEFLSFQAEWDWHYGEEDSWKIGRRSKAYKGKYEIFVKLNMK